MRGNWVGNSTLRAAVKDGTARVIGEVVEVVDAHVKLTDAQWSAGTDTGSVANALRGGVTIGPSTSAEITQSSDDSTQVTGLAQTVPFDCLVVEWIGAEASEREIESFTARLDPRADGGQPKTVDRFVCQLFRVTEGGTPGSDTTVVPISTPKYVDATGEVAADFTFDFRLTGGQAPRVGDPPRTASRPRTMIRVWALQSDGSEADNVAWMADSTITGAYTGATYSVLHHTAQQLVGSGANGGSVYLLSTAVTNMPRFTLNRASYSAASVEFTSPNEFPALSGSGDIVVTAKGSQPNDSSLTFEIDDGGGYVACVDGDVIGEDNTASGGSDLSGVSTTGPWDAKVTLTPSTDTYSAPTCVEFGIERVVSTMLNRSAEITSGGVNVDPLTLKANIARASCRLLKTGEKDFLDYGSAILSRNHTGAVSFRVWLGDPDEVHVTRKDWMLLSAWDIDDYTNGINAHAFDLLSPTRRLRFPIPKFTPTTGNNGTRKALEYSTNIAAVYSDLLDTIAELAARFIGQGCSDSSTAIYKLITEADLKDEVDAVAYLEGRAVIESQGRIKAVAVMRDDFGADNPVAHFPLGSYDPLAIGPGFTARTDETFVRYNWSDTDERYEDELRYFNATALANLGGVGLNTTHSVRDEVAKWITTSGLADSIGRRIVNHFFSGLILWQIRSLYPHPELELGDVVTITTDQFAGRNPITGEEIRGPLSALAVVVRVGDFMGTELDLWVPGYEYITVGTGTTTFEVGEVPKITIVGQRARSIGGTTSGGEGDQEFKRDVYFVPNATCKSVEVEYSFVRPIKASAQPPSSTTFDVDYDEPITVSPGETQVHTLENGAGSEAGFLIQDNAGTPIKDSNFFLTLTPYSETGGAGGTGIAGTPAKIQTDRLGDSDDVGVRMVSQSGQEISGKQLRTASASGLKTTWNTSDGEIDVALDCIVVTATIDFPSFNPTNNQTVTVTGAAVDDTVIVTPIDGISEEITLMAWVSSADTVTVRANNSSGTAINPASRDYKITVLKV